MPNYDVTSIMNPITLHYNVISFRNFITFPLYYNVITVLVSITLNYITMCFFPYDFHYHIHSITISVTLHYRIISLHFLLM